MSTTKVTIDDVAARAGVSIKTVSRVVNREPNVREATRIKVEAAIAELNYRPNPSARNLASTRSHLIGLVYDDPSAYEIPSAGYVLRLQEGALAACRASGFELLIHPCNYRNRNVGRELSDLIEQARPRGIVIAAPLSNMPKIVSAIARTGTPLVRLSPGVATGKDVSVATNDREISAEMTRYIASLGHKRIAFIKGHRSHKAVGNRFRGYRDGLKESDLPFDERLIAEGDNSFGSGEDAATALLKGRFRPTAIFAANDDMAAGAVRYAESRGIAIPGELSIAGCDDVALARQILPTLTTIRQPLRSMAEAAALALIQNNPVNADGPRQEVIPGRLMIRESTGPAPG